MGGAPGRCQPMKFLALSVILALAVTLSSGFSVEHALHQEWSLFKITHGKTYAAAEEELRMTIYLQNRDMIAAHNARFEKGEVSYSMKMNQFGDMLPEEFEAMQTYKPQEFSEETPLFMTPANFKAPSSVDWRNQGLVTGVKDQGQCGGCWSFSATGALEGQYFRKTGQLISLSEQNLIDCSSSYGNHGCNGGVVQWAYNYIKDNRGVDTESSYPYEGRDASCRYSSAYRGATCTGYVSIRRNDENDLLNAVGSVGPVSVSLYASTQGFQFYSSGVYVASSCPKTINHAVLAVGYGTDSYYGPYWIIKNSWGTGWGDAGYIKMARGGNQCGIASQACYPTV